MGLMSVSGSVANWAHVGGLLFGVAGAFAFHLGVEADTEAIRNEAEYYAGSGIAGAAAVKYAQLAERAPDDPYILLEKAKAEAASRHETAVPRSMENATADAAKVVDLFLKQGRRDEALAAAHDLTDPPCSLELLPRTLLIAGSLAETKRDFAFSAQVYGDVIRRALAESPEAEKAWYRLAHVYNAAGRPDDARKVWAVYRQRYPGSSWVQYADSALIALG